MPKNIHPLADTHPRPTAESEPQLLDTEINPARSSTQSSIVVEILSPQHKSTVLAQSVLLRATASKGNKDLSGHIRWRSNVDGSLGRGGEVTVALTEGKHILSASVRHPAGSRAATARSAESTTEERDNKTTDRVTVCASDPTSYPGDDTCFDA